MVWLRLVVVVGLVRCRAILACIARSRLAGQGAHCADEIVTSKCEISNLHDAKKLGTFFEMASREIHDRPRYIIYKKIRTGDIFVYIGQKTSRRTQVDDSYKHPAPARVPFILEATASFCNLNSASI